MKAGGIIIASDAPTITSSLLPLLINSTPAFILYCDVAHAPMKCPETPRLPVTYALMKSAVISGKVKEIVFDDALFPIG